MNMEEEVTILSCIPFDSRPMRITSGMQQSNADFHCMITDCNVVQKNEFAHSGYVGLPPSDS